MPQVQPLLPWQLERERELWRRLLLADPTLAQHSPLAERALSAKGSPLELLAEAVPREAYAAALLTLRREPPPPLEWAALSVLGEAGRGSQGIVYWALRGSERLALKVLSQRGERALARFEREVTLLQRMEHPAILPLRAAGSHEGAAFLATPACLGGDLSARAPLSSEGAIALLRRLAAGLAHAHQAGVIHRDLKPSNVLFDERGQAYLSDFGLAHDERAEQLTETHATLGTLPYLAPELLGGGARAAGPAADVYGLGALLHLALTGAPPHGSRTIGALALAARGGFRGLPPGPWDASGERPWLEAILGLALEPNPRQRADLATLARAL